MREKDDHWDTSGQSGFDQAVARVARRGIVVMAGLTTRYKKDDQIWFTFFHEIGHILLHRDRQSFVLDNADENLSDAVIAPTVAPGTGCPAWSLTVTAMICEGRRTMGMRLPSCLGGTGDR